MRDVGSQWQMSFVWAQFTIRNEDGNIFEIFCRYCCRKLKRKMPISRILENKARLLYQISQWEIMRWLYYSATLLLIYSIIFYLLNSTNSKPSDLVSTNTTKANTQERKIAYSPRCEYEDCVLTQNKQILFILILQNSTSMRELSIIRDTWCKDINQQDILYVLEIGGRINHESMERYLILKIEDQESLLSTVFQYIERNKLLELYPWYFMLSSTYVYVRVEKLIETFTKIDPNQVIAFGLGSGSVDGLCAVEHGIVLSEALIRVVTPCLRYQGDYIRSLGMCLRKFEVNCISDPDSELGIVFSTEISHMNNILAGKSRGISDVILINTPAPNDIFYLLKAAIYQERYFDIINEIKQLDSVEKSLKGLIGGEEVAINNPIEFAELKLHKDIWLEIKNSTLVSNLSQKPGIKLNQEQQKEIDKIGEKTYKQKKLKIGLSSYDFLNLRDVVIEQTFEKRMYYFTGLVETRFPDYKFVQMYKEDIRSYEGSIQSITSLDRNSESVKTAIVLILSAHTPSDIVNNFADQNDEILAQLNIEHFVIKIEQQEYEYEKQILIALLKVKLRDYIIILLTAPIRVTQQLIEFSQEMTIKGHQIYTPKWCDYHSSENLSLMSIYSQDLFKISTDKWIDCRPRELLICVKNDIEKSTRFLVLETIEDVCE